MNPPLWSITGPTVAPWTFEIELATGVGVVGFDVIGVNPRREGRVGERRGRRGDGADHLEVDAVSGPFDVIVIVGIADPRKADRRGIDVGPCQHGGAHWDKDGDRRRRCRAAGLIGGHNLVVVRLTDNEWAGVAVTRRAGRHRGEQAEVDPIRRTEDLDAGCRGPRRGAGLDQPSVISSSPLALSWPFSPVGVTGAVVESGNSPKTDSSYCEPTKTSPSATVGTVNLTAPPI